jgi:hypothetical protein
MFMPFYTQCKMIILYAWRSGQLAYGNRRL